jgi:hypothetical protein
MTLRRQFPEPLAEDDARIVLRELAESLGPIGDNRRSTADTAALSARKLVCTAMSSIVSTMADQIGWVSRGLRDSEAPGVPSFLAR